MTLSDKLGSLEKSFEMTITALAEQEDLSPEDRYTKANQFLADYIEDLGDVIRCAAERLDGEATLQALVNLRELAHNELMTLLEILAEKGVEVEWSPKDAEESAQKGGDE